MKYLFPVVFFILLVFNSCKDGGNPVNPDPDPTPTAPTLLSPADKASDVAFPVILTWNAFEGASSYLLQVSIDTAFSTLVFDRTIAGATGRLVTGLSDTTNYYWRVKADTGTEWSAIWSFKTAPTGGSLPDVTTLLSPADSAFNQPVSLTLFWDPSSGAVSYNLQVSESGSFFPLVYSITDIKGTSHQITGLNDSTRYFWRVGATNKRGSSVFSIPRLFYTVGTDTPGVPVPNYPANGATNLTFPVTLIWNIVTAAEYYICQVSKSITFDTLIFNETLFSTNYQLTGLTYSTNYYWRVKSVNAIGSSDFSGVRSFTTYSGLPDAPVLSLPSNGSTMKTLTPTLSWASAALASGYRVQVSAVSSFATLLINQTTSGISFQAGGLTYGTTYYWRVYATNGVGSSGPSAAWSFITYTGLPETPELLSPANGSKNQPIAPMLIWNSSYGATGYRLQVSESNTFATLVVNKLVSATSYLCAGLSFSSGYYWRVSATNNAGSSAWSSVWNFKLVMGNIPCTGTPTVTYEGQTYNTVQMGNQCWFKENLNVGTMIAGAIEQLNNSKPEKYCYDDIESNCTIYGGLYQWGEAMGYSSMVGARGICPPGWHIPAKTDFQTLNETVNGNGNMLKRNDQGIALGQGTNESGFSALLAGGRFSDGSFQSLNNMTVLWTSEMKSATHADVFYLTGNYSQTAITEYAFDSGGSLRCIKD